MKETIEEIIKSIYKELRKSSNEPISLFSGSCGHILFKVTFCEQFQNTDLSDSLSHKLQEIAENSFGNQNSTICNGKSGINWLFVYLFKQGYLDQEIKDIICSDDNSLALTAEEFITEGQYDYLHGALGIAYYLLYHPSFTTTFFFEKVFIELNRIKEMFGGVIPSWDFENRRFADGSVDLGLAHGLPSILKYCIQCYKQNICKKQAAEFADSIVGFLLKNRKEDVSFSYYPSFYKEAEISSHRSRLGWCYGDLSLAYILYQYGECFSKKDVKDFALKILKDTTTRQSKENTRVKDAGICHGSAGIAHIYNKLWHYTGEEIFKEACKFWINDIISIWKKGDGTIFKKYNGISDCYEISSSLLEGSTGVGLVLLSYLSGDCSWDYCLMLND